MKELFKVQFVIHKNDYIPFKDIMPKFKGSSLENVEQDVLI